MNYKTIIIGGSFAGLSTAYFTKSDEILILEKQEEPGQTQKSTCGTFVDVIEKLNCEKSILKVFDTVTFHSNLGSKAEIELSRPTCTIDYKVFCESMVDGLGNAEVITDSNVFKISGHHKKEVHCKDKSYKSEIVADCSGWKAVTANWQMNHVDVSKMACGIESEVEYNGDTDSIHIYFGSEFIKGGYGWVFPVGKNRARIGVGGYNKTNILKQMKKFMKLLDVNVDENRLDVHGGVIPCSGLKEPVIDGVFLVGDACSQVLPLSGEGIRKAVSYAEICGNLITKALNDELELSEAQDIYTRKVYESRKFYAGLYLIQKMAIHTPDRAWDNVIKKLNDERLAQKVLTIYLNDEQLPSGIALFKKISKVVNLDLISILKEKRSEVTIK